MVLVMPVRGRQFLLLDMTSSGGNRVNSVSARGNTLLVEDVAPESCDVDGTTMLWNRLSREPFIFARPVVLTRLTSSTASLNAIRQRREGSLTFPDES